MNVDDSEFDYIMDATGKPKAIVVPLEVLNALQEERNDTEYLNGSPAMRARLEAALARKEAVPFEEVRKELGL